MNDLDQLEKRFVDLLKEDREISRRYETARRMNPRQWIDIWKLSVITGKPFDEIIDHISKKENET